MNTDNLKKYAIYLMELYRSNNSRYSDSKIYWELNQFVEQGRIKDALYKSDNHNLKLTVLNFIRTDIVKFLKDLDIKVNIDTFEEFNSKKL